MAVLHVAGLPGAADPGVRDGLVHLRHVHYNPQRHCRVHVRVLLRLSTTHPSQSQKDP